MQSIHDRVLDELKARIRAFRPGRPDDWDTTMGAIINRAQYDRILAYIDSAKREGAALVCGGRAAEFTGSCRRPFHRAHGVQRRDAAMKIAREEIFGPVLSVMKWNDEAAMIRDVNAVEVGLTCSIWTNDFSAALRTAYAAQAGYVWVNEVSRHFLGAPFGGVKQSGLGREECLEELLAFTQEKNIHVKFA